MHASDVRGVTTVLRRAGAPHQNALLVSSIGMTVKVFATKGDGPRADRPARARRGHAGGLFGMGTSFRSALTHGGRVDVVELVPNVLAAFEFFRRCGRGATESARPHDPQRRPQLPAAHEAPLRRDVDRRRR
jgi:hypothetical protein